MSYVGIIVSFAIVNNVLLSELLGLSPIFGATRRIESATALGVAVTIVTGVAATLAWVVETLVLAPLGWEFLRVIIVVILSAGTAQLMDLLFSRLFRRLYQGYGAFFPLLTANSAVVGVVLFLVRGSYGPFECFVAGASGGVGVLLALVLLFCLRERLESEWVPEMFRGMPITLISAGLMAMAFLAFDKGFLVKLFG